MRWKASDPAEQGLQPTRGARFVVVRRGALRLPGAAEARRYEVGAWLRNPWPGLLAEPHPGRLLAQRVDQFADELGFERARIVGWGLAQAVLSAWWRLEDHWYGWE